MVEPLSAARVRSQSHHCVHALLGNPLRKWPLLSRESFIACLRQGSKEMTHTHFFRLTTGCWNTSTSRLFCSSLWGSTQSPRHAQWCFHIPYVTYIEFFHLSLCSHAGIPSLYNTFIPDQIIMWPITHLLFHMVLYACALRMSYASSGSPQTCPAWH